MKPASSNLWTPAFTTSTFSSNILWSFCFLGLIVGLTCNRCSITSLLTPTRLEVDHTKMSLFLSRNASSYVCSCWLDSTPMHMVLSGTLGSNGTFLNSPSASMAFLHSAEASALCWPVKVLCCSRSSRRKYTFLWPSVKPFAMFLASC
jgi:hypothetical protein